MKNTFKNPPPEYRATLFWSWNDDLTEEEVSKQVSEMAKQGLAGGFMHSRVGLITPYLSNKWFKCVAAAIKEAKKQDIYTWIYDEDGFPSGHAGGMVAKTSDDFRARALECRVLGRKKTALPRGAALFAVKRRGKKLLSFRKLSGGNMRHGKDEMLTSFHIFKHPDSSWFNNYSYTDNGNPEAVKTFLKIAYEPYYRRFGKEFGKTLPAVFADEPHMAYDEPFHFCWSKDYRSAFKKRKGYDIWDRLPMMIFEGEGFEQVRYDYHDVLGDLFLTAFCKQIYEWCDRRGIDFTGHYWEHIFTTQYNVGTVMSTYEYMHRPGIDCLGRLPEKNEHAMQYDNVVMNKEVSSVANQFGRKWIMSETYGGGGWDLDFESQKRIAEWQYALGINFFVFHLALYSLKGCRKRDFPPSFMYHQPWWKYHRVLTDRLARLGVLLTEGRYVADVLMLHPMETCWILRDPRESHTPDNPAVKLEYVFRRLSKWLLEMHCGHDYGDEKLLGKHAAVKNGKVRMKKSTYRTVIIPPCRTLRKTTLDLLRQHVKTGGKVIAIRPLPTLVNALPSREVRDFLASGGVTVIDDSRAALRASLPEETLDVRDDQNRNLSAVYVHRRKAGKKDIYYFVNNEMKEHTANVRIEGPGRLEKWDVATGKVAPIRSTTQRGNTTFRLPFAPGGSQLVTLDRARKPVRVKSERRLRTVREIPLKGQWKAHRKAPNSLVLDFCEFRIGNGKWRERAPVWKAQAIIRKHYGLEDLRRNRQTQFWCVYKDLKDLGNIALRFEFDMTVASTGRPIYLVVEDGHRFNVSVNGRHVPYRDAGSWIDPAFKKILITKFVKKGRNEVLLEAPFRADLELDNVYVIGDFAVKKIKGSYRIASEKDSIRIGDWTEQGYPFFAGSLAYRRSFKLERKPVGGLFIEMDKPAAVVTKVTVNGKRAAILGWPPYSTDISRFVKKGDNEVEIECTNSFRNLLGPLHSRKKDPVIVGPQMFSDEENWTDDYHLIPRGLLTPPRLVWKKQ